MHKYFLIRGWLAQNQKCFKYIAKVDISQKRVPGQDIFDMLYENKLDLQKDGFFKRKIA